jgi:hypothetical protein
MAQSESVVARIAAFDLARRPDAGALVKDEHGMPRFFFHGTRGPDFAEFSCNGVPVDDEGLPLSPDSGPDPTAYMGAHFAESSTIAAQFANRTTSWMRGRPHVYADGQAPNPRVIAVALKAERTADFGTEDELRQFVFRSGSISDDYLLEAVMRHHGVEAETAEGDAWLARYDDEPDLRQKANEYLFMKRRLGDGDEEAMSGEAAGFGEAARQQFIAQGYDSVRYGNDIEGGVCWIAFQPDQVLRAYVDRDPSRQHPEPAFERYVSETDRNPDVEMSEDSAPAVLRPLPIPRGESPVMSI